MTPPNLNLEMRLNITEYKNKSHLDYINELKLIIEKDDIPNLLALLNDFNEEIIKMNFVHLHSNINNLITKITPYDSCKQWLKEDDIKYFFDSVEHECTIMLKEANKSVDTFAGANKPESAQPNTGSIREMGSPALKGRRLLEGNEDVFGKVKGISLDKLVPENDFYGAKLSKLTPNVISDEIERIIYKSHDTEVSHEKPSKRRVSIMVDHKSFIKQQEEMLEYPFKQEPLDCVIF